MKGFQIGHKQSNTGRTHFKKGTVSLRKGKKHSEESKRKMSESLKGRKAPKSAFKKGQTLGEKNVNWKGGITPENNKLRNSPKARDWRRIIFIRDGFTCQVCKNVGGKLQAHHIKSWAKYPKLRFEISNGITLCEECHKLTDNYKRKTLLTN